MSSNPNPGRQWSADPEFVIPSRPEKLKRAELVNTVLQLKKAGFTLRQISVCLKLPFKKVQKILFTALKKLGRMMAQHTEELFALEMERLEELHRALYPKAMAGDVRSMEQLIRIAERRAKLMGFDAPLKQDITTDIKLSSLSPEELLEQARSLGLNLPVEAPKNLPQYLPGEAPDCFEIEDAVTEPTTSCDPFVPTRQPISVEKPDEASLNKTPFDQGE